MNDCNVTYEEGTRCRMQNTQSSNVRNEWYGTDQTAEIPNVIEITQRDHDMNTSTNEQVT